MIFNITTFGAVGDGKTLNTASIQAAIDACYESGGGRVLISDGIYMTGSLILKSNVELHIEANATILGSPDVNDYPEKSKLSHVATPNLPRERNASLLFAEESENIAISGRGKIDCNGHNFVVEKQVHMGWKYERINAPTPPRAVFFTGCRNIKIEDITICNLPAGWCYWIHDCDYVSFNKCKIIAEVQYPNNDGIHINSSRNVTISNCDIKCGDDCIIVRANNRSLESNKVSEKISVTNCNLTSYSAGIRIAWTNDGTIRNCTFSNLVMTDTTCGISIMLPNLFEKSTDYGREATLVENFLFDNIVMDEIYDNPIKILIESKGVSCDGIRNISFSNLRVKALELPRIHGRADCVIKNIIFNNCHFIRTKAFEKIPRLQHGAGNCQQSVSKDPFSYVENIVFNNSSFTTDEGNI